MCANDEIEVGRDADPRDARRVGVAPSTVRLTMRRFEAAGLAWPLPARSPTRRWRPGCSPRGSRSRHAGPSPARRAGLGGDAPRTQAQARHAADPVGRVHRGQPDGYRYSRFCELYRGWEAGCR